MVKQEVVCVCVNRELFDVVICGDVRWWMQHSVVQERSEGGG